MKRAVVVAAERSEHQQSWGSSFAEGLRRHGWHVELTESPRCADLLVRWGVRDRVAIEAQRQAGGEVVILERGYLGDRFKWSSVSFGGGLNGRGLFRGIPNDTARFEMNFGALMRPWRDRKGYALLIGQVPGDMSLARLKSINLWYESTAAILRHKGYEVFFRPHPVAVKIGHATPDLRACKVIGGTLADALAGAATVATYNSNTAVEAVLDGVPTSADDIGSMAWDVTAREPGERIMPERDRWAARLAWKQFTQEEMASGFCWEVVSAAS